MKYEIAHRPGGYGYDLIIFTKKIKYLAILKYAPNKLLPAEAINQLIATATSRKSAVLFITNANISLRLFYEFVKYKQDTPTGYPIHLIAAYSPDELLARLKAVLGLPENW